MPSGITFDAESHHFQAKYEHPWGGVASDAAPMDIPPNFLASVNGLNIKDGILPTTIYDASPISTTGITANYLVKVFNIFSDIYAFDYQGNAYKYNGTIFVLDKTCADAAGTITVPEPSCVQVINGIAYSFNFTTGKICVYTPGISYVLGDDFVGGKYCFTLDQYLITANTNQPTDTPAIKQGRVNWSSPDGFTTWNPAVDRTAGFNVLTDVSDYISGGFALGNVGYILRSQGLTQMTPTGIGIAPFDFTSLWASEVGIGCTMPATFSQYGNVAIWANDNNIYAFTGSSMPVEITGSAKTAIYSDIYGSQGKYANPSATFVCGSFGNNSATPAIPNAVTIPSPELEYTLAIITLIAQGALHFISVTLWIYNLKSKTWMRTSNAIRPLIPANNGNLYFYDMQPVNIIFTGDAGTITISNTSARFTSLLNLGVGTTGEGTPALPVLLNKYQAAINFPASAPSGAQVFSLSFKQEEIVLTKQPEVRGVAIKAVGVGTLNVHITGNINPTKNASAPTLIDKAFTPVTINSTTPITLYSSGTFTGEDPQCTITGSSFDGVIIKAAMFGTYADGEPF